MKKNIKGSVNPFEINNTHIAATVTPPPAPMQVYSINFFV